MCLITIIALLLAICICKTQACHNGGDEGDNQDQNRPSLYVRLRNVFRDDGDPNRRD